MGPARRSPAGGLRGQPPAGGCRPITGRLFSRRQCPGFPSYTAALCARTQYIINSHTAWGLPSTACETTGLFSHPMGRRLRTPRVPVPAAQSAGGQQSGLTAPRPARVAP